MVAELPERDGEANKKIVVQISICYRFFYIHELDKIFKDIRFFGLNRLNRPTG